MLNEKEFEKLKSNLEAGFKENSGKEFYLTFYIGYVWALYDYDIIDINQFEILYKKYHEWKQKYMKDSTFSLITSNGYFW